MYSFIVLRFIAFYVNVRLVIARAAFSFVGTHDDLDIYNFGDKFLLGAILDGMKLARRIGVDEGISDLERLCGTIELRADIEKELAAYAMYDFSVEIGSGMYSLYKKQLARHLS